MLYHLILLFTCLFCLPHWGYAQGVVDSSATKSNEVKKLILYSTAGYAVTMTGLYHIWYAQNEQEEFHWFNDNAEWQGLDKSGHALSSFHLAHAATDGLQLAGLSRNKARLWGSLSSWAMMSTIEFFDGYATGYGASWGDLVANASGSSLFLLQDLEALPITVTPKFSFHTTSYAAIRPNTLGRNLPEQLIKDYNGQTYWLSIGLQNNQHPWLKYINLSVGYGGQEMVYGRNSENLAAGFSAHKQWYIAPDINLQRLPVRKNWQRLALRFLDMIHLPAPTLSYSQGRLKAHALYF